MTHPAIFRDLTFAEAEAVSCAERKLLLISVSSPLSLPCRRMNESTWRDPAVCDWVARHAIAIQVPPEASVAEGLGIMSLPTVVAMRDGAELDRASDARPANLLLDWLEGLRSGRLDLDRLLGMTHLDYRSRLQLAEALALHSRFEDALKEFLALWNAADWASDRRPLLVSALRLLVDHHPPAREAFTRLREEARARVPDRRGLADFLALSDLLDGQATALAWFEQLEAEPAMWERMDELPECVELAARCGAWEQMGNHLRDPVPKLQDLHASTLRALEQAPPGVPAEYMEEVREMLLKSVRNRAAWLCRCLLAARRDEETAQLAAVARQLEPSEAMALALSEVGVP